MVLSLKDKNIIQLIDKRGLIWLKMNHYEFFIRLMTNDRKLRKEYIVEEFIDLWTTKKFPYHIYNYYYWRRFLDFWLDHSNRLVFLDFARILYEYQKTI